MRLKKRHIRKKESGRSLETCGCKRVSETHSSSKVLTLPQKDGSEQRQTRDSRSDQIRSDLFFLLSCLTLPDDKELCVYRRTAKYGVHMQACWFGLIIIQGGYCIRTLVGGGLDYFSQHDQVISTWVRTGCAVITTRKPWLAGRPSCLGWARDPSLVRTDPSSHPPANLNFPPSTFFIFFFFF